MAVSRCIVPFIGRNRDCYVGFLTFRCKCKKVSVPHRNGPCRTEPSPHAMPINLLPSTMRPKPRGFTLIEAMIVVALLAILSSVAVPSFRSMMANNRVSSANAELQALLLYARAEAVYRRTGMAVAMDTHHRHWEVFPATIDGSSSVTVTGAAVRETKLSPAVTVFSSGNTLGNAAVYFDAAGKATSKPSNQLSITLEAPFATQKRCLKVTAAGLVRSLSC